MDHLLPYIIGNIERFKLRHQVQRFDSGAIMVDFWIDGNLHVIQIDRDSIGLSLVTKDAGYFDVIPDYSFTDDDRFKEAFEKVLSLQQYTGKEAALQKPFNAYRDWRDFFTKRLLDTGAFSLSPALPKSDTDKEIYQALTGNLETSIHIGYFSSVTLMYIQIINPCTPGKNRQQEIEHLYNTSLMSKNNMARPGLSSMKLMFRV